MTASTRDAKKWREITLLVPDLWDEILPEFLEEQGFSGLWLDREEVPPHRLLLRAYVDETTWKPEQQERIESHLRELSHAFPTDLQPIAFETRVIEEEDWAAKWLPFFEPLKIGPVWIRPSLRSVDVGIGEKEIVLDPGQAFGTGHHETTQLCMKALLEIGPSLEEEAPVLDLGTGTGILAMFAACLGLKNILALDNDPAAVEVARQNVARNGLEHVVRVGDQPIQFTGSRFRLILANLTATLHKELVEEMLNHLEKGGLLVLGGILTGESQGVSRTFSRKGLKLVRENTQDDWACLILEMIDGGG